MSDWWAKQESLENLEALAEEQYFDGKVNEILDLLKTLSDPQIEKIASGCRVELYERQSYEDFVNKLPF